MVTTVGMKLSGALFVSTIIILNALCVHTNLGYIIQSYSHHLKARQVVLGVISALEVDTEVISSSGPEVSIEVT